MWADEEWSLSRLLTVAAPDRRPEAEASALRRTQQLGRDLDQHMQQLISSCVSCHGRSLSRMFASSLQSAGVAARILHSPFLFIFSCLSLGYRFGTAADSSASAAN